MENNIILVSEDEELAKEIAAKLVFLRNGDKTVLSDYNDVLRDIELNSGNIILLLENERTIDVVKALRQNAGLCIILVANSLDSEMILEGYDCGIDDFILKDAPDFEFVCRIVNNIKYNSVKSVLMRNCKLMEQLKIIDELSGFYNYNFSKQIIENYIDDNLFDTGIFMALSPSENAKFNFSVEKFADAIRKSVRNSDIVTLGKGTRFYIFLPQTDMNGALVVLNKIKENSEIDVCAGISTIEHKQFEEFECDSLQALADALATNAEYIFAKENEPVVNDWLDTPKGYKFFKNIYGKKLEKVIAPVFYRLQKAYEEKLFKTKIEQFTGEEQCVFKLKNDKFESTLTIAYSGFANVIIYIVHDGLDSPENSEISLPLNKITANGLSEIVENFILEFKKEI